MSGSVTFAANSATADLNIAPINDSVAELTESVVVSLATGTGYTIGASWTATVNIADNETPVVSVAWVYDAFEGWSGMLEFSRMGDLSQSIVVNFTHSGTATPGLDYDSIGTSIAFAAGAAVAPLPVAALIDSVYDNDETVIATIVNPSGYIIGAANAATLRIIDNVAPPPLPQHLFDLDVNANGSLADPIDLAANYLPGYEGTVQKVSVGTSFNTGEYRGQQMKLIVDGLGRDTSQLKRIVFEMTAVSQLGGYASNKSSPISVGLDDYSLHPAYDERIISIDRDSFDSGGPFPTGGHMDATKTWVHFYAKDYGASARLVARVYVYDGAGERLVRTLELRVPKDTDGDGFADKWEIAMVARGRDQYGLPQLPDHLALEVYGAPGVYGAHTDEEEADPDGTIEGRPLVAQKDTGDAYTVLEEYRGYILDGGGLDGAGANGHAGGHIRLDPARKEVLVEVDHAGTLESLPAAPNEPADPAAKLNARLKQVLNGASGMFSNTQRGAGIYMYYLFDQPNLNLPKADVETVEKWQEKLRTTRNAALASDFLHFLFINEGSYDVRLTAPAEAFDPKQNPDGSSDRTYAGAVLATKDVATAFPATTWNLQDQLYACAIAHELTHLLIDCVNKPGFDKREHTTNPDPTAPEACLMFKDTRFDNRTFLTVKLYDLVQREIAMRTNQTFGH